MYDYILEGKGLFIGVYRYKGMIVEKLWGIR